jgi:uncharacterized SAM-binding protein YcdF (DUF218 family)
LRRRIFRWGRQLVGLACIVGLALVLMAPGRVLPPVAEFLNVSEPPRATDCVLVLNGDPNTRPFAAAALVNAGLAREVLLTTQRLALESGAVRDGALPSELVLTKRILQVRGVPGEAVRVLQGGEIDNTYDEARVLNEFLDAHPDVRVAVVTNSFHTRRARWVFRRVLGEKASRVYFVGVPRDRVAEQTWWRTKEGCMVYLIEYGKFLYYRLRY